VEDIKAWIDEGRAQVTRVVLDASLPRPVRKASR
jgi:hypothetical protein